VAPDGVRVAVVMELNTSVVVTIGAISGEQGASPLLTLSRAQLAPPVGATAFTGLSWYGPDHVIALATPGPVVSEYLVSGGSATSLPVDPGMESVSASWASPLIAAVPGVHIAANTSLTGSWTDLGSGSVPAYPG
jgi:Lipoprotein LpqB beta-propeller domain